jgi:GR25 family glycosyltransferase involved in LPS biosynthesis
MIILYMQAPPMLKTIADIKNIFYINLDKREDRRAHIEKQLTAVGLPTFERFTAFPMKNGRVGCTLSHIKCLEKAKCRKYDHILICEDDTLFTQPALLVQQLNNFLTNMRSFDVLLLAGNNLPPHTVINSTCVKVRNCQTTTCYLVRAHYFDTLIKNYKEGLKLLLRAEDKHFHYAIDKYWLSLQKKDNWYLLTPLTVVQMEDYSDIEKKKTNYTSHMLDLNKTALLQRALQQQKAIQQQLQAQQHQPQTPAVQPQAQHMPTQPSQ